MGQAASSPPSPAPDRRPALWRRSTSRFMDGEQDTSPMTSRRPSHRRSSSINRLSQFLHSSSAVDAPSDQPSRPSRLQRARHSLALTSPALFARRDRDASPRRASIPLLVSRQAPVPERTRAPATQLALPDVQMPDLDLDFSNLTTSVSAGGSSGPRPPSRRSSLRLPNSLSDRLDRLAGLRQQRGGGGSNTILRRRRSPLLHQGEDNTALLSRLLSVAAAATAATLLEGNEQAMAEARGIAGDGDEGTFDGFLQSLESGRLASALRQGGHFPEDDGSNTGSGHPPLNFFRMFRFGSPASTASRGSGTTSEQGQQTGAHDSPRSGDGGSDGRMVPIIIVGIRAVTPGSSNNPDDTGVPPFLDALSTFPTTPFGASPVGHETIDNILRPPQNGTRFSHRRRASMGGMGTFPSGYDAQRHHRSPERSRPRSVASEAASWPRPPPATPASPTLSTVTSRNSTPAQTVPTSRRSSLGSPAQRESIIRTTTTTTLETTSEDAPLRPRAARQRRLSESDFSRNNYSSRRNGIVEPDNAPIENTRSWIIYVLGGSYPENHPILTTPSLFTDSPTYEDMMLLSALLGPAKPPVASEKDIADAPGVYRIQGGDDGVLVAVPTVEGDRIPLVLEQRCLVCLCDFELHEQARRLVKCSHIFHKDCIDEWLTKGRNSCPLCRGQGVHENEMPHDSTSSTEDSPGL